LIDRRTFLAGTGAVLLAAPLAAEAQKSEKMARVGILGIGPAPSPQELAKSVSTNRFWLSMRQLGWVDGQNMVVERRFGESADQLRTGAADLVRLKSALLNPSKVALLREDVTTSALPQILARYDQQAATAARTLGIEVHTFIVRRAGDLAAAFLGMMKNQDKGVLVTSSTFMFVHRQAIVDLAAAHRIAAVYELQGFVEPGGLMSYGVNVSEMERRAATYVDKILKGAKPADLPVEQPTNFEFVMNLKTAKALGLTIPQSLLLRADEVIQ
jgi:ABC transporter substrate binding protein